MASMRGGKPYPLGPQIDARGANFALFSAHAEKVELCLFDEHGRREVERVALPEHTDGVWHGYLPEARPGLLYGYRVYGPYAPNEGHRFNPNKLLIDPYARELDGRFEISDLHFGYRVGSARGDLSFDRRDNARVVPKCRLVDESFTWGSDAQLRRPWHDTVIYEMHVAGFTKLNEAVEPRVRGTFAGLRSQAVIQHLTHLGVTAIELLPIHGFVDDRHLVERGLRNYWGYNSIAFFAPDPRYLVRGQHFEFKQTVAALHAGGIEVILDVVFNHTAEGNEMGPTLCFRGIDNASYYWLSPDSRRHYVDFTGTGNSLNISHPRVLQMVVDALRYWTEVMHVDGFRFDLASTLARTRNGFDPDAPFLDVLTQDPILAKVKLIAEPWDVGDGGYRVGGFPPGWSEWNDRYRDTMRRYWRGDGGIIGEVAARFAGSSDIYKRDGRRPRAGINFVTAHDGFTLQDLVSYNEKHNEANLEDNADGHSDNLSWNCGIEGPTDDEAIIALRRQQRRNFLATLLLSQGVPMLLAGDEVANSQNGNNNAYCQDNEIGWIDWSHKGVVGDDLCDFIARLVTIRNDCHLSSDRFLEGKARHGGGNRDIAWFRADGQEMSEPDWQFPDARFLAFVLDGVPYPTLIFFNAHFEALSVVLPQVPNVKVWRTEIDTVDPAGRSNGQNAPGAATEVPARAVIVMFGKAS
ncbi:MAG TPA: glycogen debranching protein GlgX [Stellaceae bacterium]|nr:glycogen debranching protein GlgX [Stellaceae bacterium]